ncbi:MAG TPA: hypothetical protein PKK26_03615 [Candidatus Wallbacteria bacterium]|nr:hypothetical protein [Candidatus Wallbacteria bacterium]
MRNVKYWVRSRFQKAVSAGKSFTLSCWGWSETTVEEAAAKAEERLSMVLARVSSGGDIADYPYGANPLREIVIREGEDDGNGELNFIVTQNSYGCYIINTSRMMFVDIDISCEEAAPSGGSLISTVLGFLFGPPIVKKEASGSADPREVSEQAHIELLRKMAESDSRFSARVYRTCGGLRYIITHREYDPAGEESVNILKSLKCDPMYVRLCRLQKTYRARLTPKAWRCGVPKIHISYPFENSGCEKALDEWMKEYNAAGSSHATCRYLCTVGNEEINKAFEEMIKLHDEITRSDSGLKLA